MSELAPNLVDAAVLAFIGFAVWSGYKAGLVSTVYSLATWVVAATVAIALQGPASSLVASVARLPGSLASGLAFVAVIVIVETALSVVGHFAVRPIVGAVRRSRLSLVDRALGTVPAAARSLVIVVVGVLAIETLPIASELRVAIETSRTGRIVSDQVAGYQPQMAALASQFGGSGLLVTRIGEDQTQKLDLPDNLGLTDDPLAERQLFGLVNEERAKRGLSALGWDDRLVPVGRAHSSEMFRLKYFSHESPVAGSPFNRLRAAGITYSRAGENLAYAQSVAIAHRALMDSTGHRENILRPEFTRIGIGIISAGAYGRMVTQLFITP